MTKKTLTDVEKWKKRLNRKGPFYLYERSDYVCRWRPEETGYQYRVIWQDGHKTKIGMLHDHMTCRYGIKTDTVLNGERPHDLWNGVGLSDEEFEAMLAVRKGESTLPLFDLDTLEHLSH